MFSTAQHRWCCRHLYNNFKAQFPGILLRSLFWKAAKSYASWEFQEAMAKIKNENLAAFEWLVKIPTRMWARHAFDTQCKSDHITNNMTESFNHWVGPLRGKPVLTLVESLVVKIMGMVHKRYSDGCTWEHLLTPKAIKRIEIMKKRTSWLSLVPAGQMEFLVNDNGISFPVDLKKGLCQCKYWDVSGTLNVLSLLSLYFFHHLQNNNFFLLCHCRTTMPTCIELYQLSKAGYKPIH